MVVLLQGVMSGCVVVAGGDEWCYPVEVAPGTVPE